MIKGLRATLISMLTFSGSVLAEVTPDLPYPATTPDANEIARQVFFVNHFYAVENLYIQRKGKSEVTVLATRAKDSTAKVNTIRRFLNNRFNDGESLSRDIALFHSGELMGTGMLITDYIDPDKSQSYSIWLPALKKIRRYAEPPQDDAWGGSDLTFGDVYLREPRHETHELLGTETFNDCLGAMQLSEKEAKDRYLKQLAAPQCEHKGAEVYKLKSVSKFSNWWYDYRISYVDTKSFADYRTEYFKDGQMIKILDRDWTSMNLDDPRGMFWRYWYAKNLTNGHETMINVPENYVTWNNETDGPDLWTEEMLQRMRE